MRFEFDPAKSAANKAKHGIDFEEAQALWDDSKAITEPVAAPGDRASWSSAASARFWTAVVTYRGDGIRIISMRRARKHEIEDYLSQGV
jgi:uncharacterized protein